MLKRWASKFIKNCSFDFTRSKFSFLRTVSVGFVLVHSVLNLACVYTKPESFSCRDFGKA